MSRTKKIVIVVLLVGFVVFGWSTGFFAGFWQGLTGG